MLQLRVCTEINHCSYRCSLKVVKIWRLISRMAPHRSLWGKAQQLGRFSLKSNMTERQWTYNLVKNTATWKKWNSKNLSKVFGGPLMAFLMYTTKQHRFVITSHDFNGFKIGTFVALPETETPIRGKCCKQGFPITLLSLCKIYAHHITG